MGARMPPLRRLASIALWLAVAVAYVAAVLPQAEAPHLGGSDKLDHMAAFFTVTMLARLAYPGMPVLRLFPLIGLFGAAIELSQALPFVHRDAEWGDWYADLAASFVGLLVAWPLVPLVERRLD